MPLPTLFFDDGGVLNDNEVRGRQWQRLVGEYFAPRLGGAPEAWADANRLVITRMLAPENWQPLQDTSADYAGFERRYYAAWLGGMCAFVGVPTPPEPDCLALGLESEAFVIPRLRSAYPGAVEAIRQLRAAGYVLHNASGASSRTLDQFLAGMGMRDCFDRLYGPDLINTFKNGPAFYERILADLGLPAREALFIDDSPTVLAWVAQTGAQTLLVGRHADPGPFNQIASLAELPAFLGL